MVSYVPSFFNIYKDLNLLLLYLQINIGIYQRKELFIRENFVGASNFISYYFADSLPTLVMYAMGSFVTLFIAYPMANLRPTVGHFFYLYILILVSVYCYFSLAYFMSMLFNSVNFCKNIYSGLIIPLQLLMSGYLILIPKMQSWNQWGVYICPMSYYLAGASRNEFEDNEHALNADNTADDVDVVITYNDIEDQYDFHLSLVQAFFAVFLMGMFLKWIWLVSLRLFVLIQERAVRRKIIGFRRRIRAIVLCCGNTCLQWFTFSGTRTDGDDEYADA